MSFAAEPAWTLPLPFLQAQHGFKPDVLAIAPNGNRKKPNNVNC